MSDEAGPGPDAGAGPDWWSAINELAELVNQLASDVDTIGWRTPPHAQPTAQMAAQPTVRPKAR